MLTKYKLGQMLEDAVFLSQLGGDNSDASEIVITQICKTFKKVIGDFAMHTPLRYENAISYSLVDLICSLYELCEVEFSDQRKTLICIATKVIHDIYHEANQQDVLPQELSERVLQQLLLAFAKLGMSDEFFELLSNSLVPEQVQCRLFMPLNTIITNA